jgi:hypothetical protein
MTDLGMALILLSLFGYPLTLLVLFFLIIREFGRTVNERVVGRKRRFRFRLRTLLIVALVVQGALSLAAWQSPPNAADARAMLWFFIHFVFDFVLLGVGVWVLWYLLEEFFCSFARGRSVRERYHLSSTGDAPPPPAPTTRKRRKKWWTKRWPNRYRQLRPGQDYTLPIGRDEF